MILICRNVIQTLEKRYLDLMRDVFKVQCLQYFLGVTHLFYRCYAHLICLQISCECLIILVKILIVCKKTHLWSIIFWSDSIASVLWPVCQLQQLNMSWLLFNIFKNITYTKVMGISDNFFRYYMHFHITKLQRFAPRRIHISMHFDNALGFLDNFFWS